LNPARSAVLISFGETASIPYIPKDFIIFIICKFVFDLQAKSIFPESKYFLNALIRELT